MREYNNCAFLTISGGNQHKMYIWGQRWSLKPNFHTPLELSLQWRSRWSHFTLSFSFPVASPSLHIICGAFGGYLIILHRQFSSRFWAQPAIYKNAQKQNLGENNLFAISFLYQPWITSEKNLLLIESYCPLRLSRTLPSPNQSHS